MPRQVTLSEREQIAQFWNQGLSRAEIARRLGRHPTTIGRELTRNSEGSTYWASSAQQKAAAHVPRPQFPAFSRLVHGPTPNGPSVRPARELRAERFWCRPVRRLISESTKNVRLQIREEDSLPPRE